MRCGLLMAKSPPGCLFGWCFFCGPQGFYACPRRLFIFAIYSGGVTARFSFYRSPVRVLFPHFLCFFNQLVAHHSVIQQSIDFLHKRVCPRFQLVQCAIRRFLSQKKRKKNTQIRRQAPVYTSSQITSPVKHCRCIYQNPPKKVMTQGGHGQKLHPSMKKLELTSCCSSPEMSSASRSPLGDDTSPLVALVPALRDASMAWREDMESGSLVISDMEGSGEKKDWGKVGGTRIAAHVYVIG
ncbi:hypothetical protein DFJ77DRAFT_445724 [Powellomyces hirtus]|nr:hypothetical protein DFJ77DRAFT_445724 [Powellomyces hirtus]